MQGLLRRRILESLALSKPDYFWIRAREAGSTVSLSAPGISQPVLYYSTDMSSWTLWDYSSITLSNADDKVWFYGTSGYMSTGTGNNYAAFVITGSVDIGGDISCLLQEKGKVTSLDRYALRCAFQNNTAIVNAYEAYIGNLITTADTYCCNKVFYGCSNLVTAPSLTVYGNVLSNAFQNAFEGCSSIVDMSSVSISIIDASSNYQLGNAFKGCSSMVVAPYIYVGKPTNYCCNTAFDSCTSLVDATSIILPSKSVAYCSYNAMFKGCSSLKYTPVLPATTLGQQSYKQMFYGCTSLTTAPDLPALTLQNGCYNEMFRGCTALTYIKAMFTTTPSSTYTSNWVYGIPANQGTFVKNSAAEWNVSGAHGIPNGWTVQTATE